MRATGQRGPVRFVLELTPTEHGRVEGVLVREGSEPQQFSGWLDLLRLLERVAQVTEVRQRTVAQADTVGNDVEAAGGHRHGFVGLNESRGPPHHRLYGEAAPNSTPIRWKMRSMPQQPERRPSEAERRPAHFLRPPGSVTAGAGATTSAWGCRPAPVRDRKRTD